MTTNSGISGDSETWSLQQEFDDTLAVIDSFDEAINVFGHSLSGLCVLEAVARTKKARKLFVYDPAIPFQPRPSGILAVAAKQDLHVKHQKIGSPPRYGGKLLIQLSLQIP